MNLFVNVPVPAGNGSGAPVNLAGFGISKTISVAGPFAAAVTIEISNELAPTQWAPLVTFNVPDGIVLEVACRWMRASVAGYKSGLPTCDVGGSDDGGLFASLPVTPGNGVGAAIDVSALPLYKTVTVGGPFNGTVQLEVSEDGVTAWSQLGFGFTNPGQLSQKMTARFMRVVRAGVPLIAPGLPIVDVGACNDGSDAPIFVLPPKLYTVYVGKNGNDGIANGSIANPFLTVQAAMEYAYTTYVLPAEPQPVSPFIRPCVFVNAGTYDDDDQLVLPPQICVMGESRSHTRIVGNWSIDARWSNAVDMSDFRSTWSNVGLYGDINIDFDAVSSSEGKLFSDVCRFIGNVTITEKRDTPVSNMILFTDPEFLGDVTLNGIPGQFQGTLTQGGTLTFNQQTGTGVDNTFQTSGGSIGNIVVNSTIIDGPPGYSLIFAHNAQPDTTLTLNGVTSLIKADLSSVPLQANVVLAGGATLNQIFRINQLNWSGATALQPPTPYVGQQFFNTTITKPIWWNGATWMTWNGGVMALPEQWAVQDVPAATGPTVMSSQVSTNFDDLKMIRAGSIVGLRTRLTEAVTAGTLTVTVTINGAPIALNVLMGVASTGDKSIADTGTYPYAADDLIGLTFTSSVGFTPTTTDLEAWLEVVEETP